MDAYVHKCPMEHRSILLKLAKQQQNKQTNKPHAGLMKWEIYMEDVWIKLD